MNKTDDPDAPAVEYWEDVYCPRYPGRSGDSPQFHVVDHRFLYNALDQLVIKVAGDTTGLPSASFLEDLEKPSHKIPFHISAVNFVESVNKEAIAYREDNLFWKPKSVLGVGVSRSYYFLSKEVIAGARCDGFHRNETALKGTTHWMDDMNTYVEYNGFTCANREFMLYRAPTFQVPQWDAIGPRSQTIGVHPLAVEARLHYPRIVWPGYRTDQEREDARLNRVREEDCLMCQTYAVLYNVGLERYRRKAELKAAGVRFSSDLDVGTACDTKTSKPKYSSTRGCQTNFEAPKPRMQLPTTPPPVCASGKLATTPTASEVNAKRTGYARDHFRAVNKEPKSTSPKTPSIRRRSSSVDSPLTSTQQGGNAKGRKLFTETPIKSREAPAAANNGKTKEFVDDKGNSKEVVGDNEKASGSSKSCCSSEGKCDCAIKAAGRALYRDILQDELEAKEDHTRNKAKGIYHLCPNMNKRDYKKSLVYRRPETEQSPMSRHSSEASTYTSMSSQPQSDISSSTLHPTDQSCTSTCECNHQSSLIKRQNDERKSSATESEEPSSTLKSPYLFTSTDDTSAADISMSQGNASITTRRDGNAEASNVNSALASESSFEPNYYTLPRSADRELSPAEKLARNLRDVNENGADLDASLVPDSSIIRYSPTKGVSVHIGRSESSISAMGIEYDEPDNEEMPSCVVPAAAATENLFSTSEVVTCGKGSPNKRAASAPTTPREGSPQSKSPRHEDSSSVKEAEPPANGNEDVAPAHGDAAIADSDSEFFVLTEQEKIPDYLVSER